MFEGTTFIVTGANRGIGLEFVRQLTERGARVIATARKPAEADRLRELLDESAGDRLEELDVADGDSVEAFAGRLGGDDGSGTKAAVARVLINNAGIPARGKTLAETDFEEVRRAFDVNAIGPLRVTRALLPVLRRADGPMIVNVSSQLGSIANNTTGGSSYGYRGSKAALNMVTKHLANELESEGFACFVVHPGWVRTDMGGPNATLSVEESVEQLLDRVIGKAKAETHNGGYFNYDGAELPW